MRQADLDALMTDALNLNMRIVSVDVPFHARVETFRRDVRKWLNDRCIKYKTGDEPMPDGTHKIHIVILDIPAE